MMRHTCILILFMAVATACDRAPKDSFVLRGVVPGAMDSTEVNLVPNGNFQDAWTTYTKDGKFEIRGQMPAPTHCELRLNNADICERRGITDDGAMKFNEVDFFVENDDLAFSTPSVDSLPESFWRYDIRKEANYTLTGSVAQDAFVRYQRQTIPLRHAVRTAEQKYMESENIADCRQAQTAQEELARQSLAFIRGNGDIYVNLHVAETLKRSPFTYDQAYLDELAGLFAASRDTCALLREFRGYLEKAAAFTQGKPLEEGAVVAPEGKELPLLAQLNGRGYTLIDFWASWCGPCRASFPHLREMHKRYGDRVKFVSLSVDAKEADWRQAMEEERLPWPQFLASEALSKVIGDLYDITAIPTFLLVDAEGRIVFSGHSSGALELRLERL